MRNTINRGKGGGAWLAQAGERATLDISIMSLSPVLDVELT